MPAAAETLMRPSREDIVAHLYWLAAPAIGTEYKDALLEIAHERPGSEGPSDAKLFPITQYEDAADYAIGVNMEGLNVYVGASLKDPEAHRGRRTSGSDFYVATAVPIDIDTDYDAVRARMAAAVEDELTVVTGLTPTRRSQHWVRLLEPCDDLDEFQQAFASLVLHVGADAKVKDAARVMRLAGTISYPSDRKRARGYQTELTQLFANPRAKPVAVERLQNLPPIPERDAPSSTSEPRTHAGTGQEIQRGAWDRVIDGREAYWTKIVFAQIVDYQKEHGCDPTGEDIWASAWAVFEAKADLRDGRWSSERGQRELQARLRNTLRRLKAGHLGRFGVASIETGAGDEDARKVQENRALTSDRIAPAIVSQPEPVSRETKPRRLLQTLDELDDSDVEWLVDDLLPANAFVSIYGKPGAYKSFLAQYLAMMVYEGQPAFGRATRRSDVVYLALEGQRGIRRRFEAMVQHYGVTAGPGLRFITVPRDLQTSPADAQEIVNAIAEEGLKVGLIVIDTLARSFGGGDENAAKDMNAFITIADAMRLETGATVLVIHHSGKDDAKGMRGSTALLGAVDAEILTKKPVSKRGTATVTKMKDGEDGQRLAFRMVEQAVPRSLKTTLVLEPDAGAEEGEDGPAEAVEAPPARKAEPRGVNQKLALMALRKAFEDGVAETVHLGEYGNVRCVSMQMWDRYCELQPFAGNPPWRKKARAEEGRQSLVANGFVLFDRGYVWERQ